jgi:hypothetical protein
MAFRRTALFWWWLHIERNQPTTNHPSVAAYLKSSMRANVLVMAFIRPPGSASEFIGANMVSALGRAYAQNDWFVSNCDFGVR